MADIRTKLRLVLALSLMVAPPSGVRAQQNAGAVHDPANLMRERQGPRSPADTLPINQGAAGLQQMLLKLRTRASMMLIVAHPDDEDGGFLTYESRGQGARVAMLTLTRGEGGQNLMSADFDDALGLIRTQELLAADRYMGVDQFFGTEADFGFSKTKEETLSKWTHDRVLYDAVRCVRLYRPLVIASVFVGGPTDGHGHHQVAGEIAQEVFTAAADPKVFPEMGLPAWAAQKVYARMPFSRVSGEGMFDYATGRTIPVLFHNYVSGRDITHAPAATVQIHEGEKSTLEGMEGDSYVQFARRGLALEKTQIGGGARLAPTGAMDVSYTLMGSRVAANSHGLGASEGMPETEQTIFDGVDVTIQGIAELAPSVGGDRRGALTAGLDAMGRGIRGAEMDFKAQTPDSAAEGLREALAATEGLIARVEGWPETAVEAKERFGLLHELRVKRVQLQQAMAMALGITVDAEARGDVVAGQALRAQATIRSETRVEVVSAVLQVAGRDGAVTIAAQPVASPTVVSVKMPVTLRFEDRVQAGTPVTKPYFTRPGIEQPFYDVESAALRNAPETPAPLVAVVRVRTEAGDEVEVQAVVHAALQGSNAVAQRVEVVPALSVAVAPAAGIVGLTPGSFALSASVRTQMPRVGATLKLAVPYGWKAGWAKSAVELEHAGDAARLPFTVDAAKVERNGRYTLTAVGETGGQTFTEGFRAVGYAGITATNMYTPAVYRAAAVDVTTAPGLRVGYLPGTGDSVAEFLPNLGVTPVMLTTADLNQAALAKFDVVVLGVRAYAAHPQLAGAGSQPLEEYARGGGVVVVQYMTAKFGDAEAPYPIAVPGDPAHNVVVEAQPVSLLHADAPLLRWPNRITPADFGNWVAEYGHGFAASWSPKYEALLEVHDPEQDPQKGGLLVAPVGKGAYIYCALALYRQLPEGVPGAYRLFANLLSYGKNPQRK